MKILIIGGCGYIGSALYQHLKSLPSPMEVDTIDLEWFGNCVNPDNLQFDYFNCNKEFIGQYDAVILLAGYSSVQMCKNRFETHKHNVLNFLLLLEQLSPKQKFIYAGSSSVYGNVSFQIATEDQDEAHKPVNYYDLSKRQIDYYARLSGLDYYGLRFGTVCGYSPNLRTELMINKMYIDATAMGRIEITNRDIHRPILGMRDLCRAITCIITNKSNPGVYNLASFNSTVNGIAGGVVHAVSKLSHGVHNSEIKDCGQTPTYDFTINTTKFTETYDFEFAEDIHSIVQSLMDSEWKLRGPRANVPINAIQDSH